MGWSVSLQAVIFSQLKALHLLWMCQWDLLIIAGNIACPFACYLLLVYVQVSLTCQFDWNSSPRMKFVLWSGFLNVKTVTVAAIHHQHMEVYGKDIMRQQNAAKWCAEFWGGGISMEVCERSSKPRTVRTADTCALVENSIPNRRTTPVTPVAPRPLLGPFTPHPLLLRLFKCHDLC